MSLNFLLAQLTEVCKTLPAVAEISRETKAAESKDKLPQEEFIRAILEKIPLATLATGYPKLATITGIVTRGAYKDSDCEDLIKALQQADTTCVHLLNIGGTLKKLTKNGRVYII